MSAEPVQDQQQKLRAALIRSLREVEQLRGQLDAVQAATREPLAIIGIGLQLPGGVTDISSLWALLEKGGDAIQPVPIERWDADAHYHPDPEQRGKSYVREGGFLDHVDRFDAEFFGISPREARYIDPQHRLLLEAAWRALEDAAIAPDSLRDSRTGVYIGIGPCDYEHLQGDRQNADAYAVMGTHTSFAAGRLAYTLGLQGPALAVDTACSSSLVAVHLACQALRCGECSLALVGGVHVMTSAAGFALLSRSKTVAPDGRSKAFSASADGYGRGEGVVVLALERLSDAQANGRRILARIRGSAINHDGISSGITVPNGRSQQKVIHTALANAGLSAADIDFVECHGTGTALGDPIEVNALAAVYGEGRNSSAPLKLGTIKSNIGHLESAAGVAGIARLVASMGHRQLPASLHATPLNPQIEWDQLNVEVVDQLQAWHTSDDTPLRAGVSGFGLSGSNAHIIIESPPPATLAQSAEDSNTPRVADELPVLISARSPAALTAQVRVLRDHLQDQGGLSLAAIASVLATGRNHFSQRLAIVAKQTSGLSKTLSDWLDGENPGNTISGTDDGGRMALLFSGQGSQRAEMGTGLYDKYPVFQQVIDDICSRFDTISGSTTALRELMFATAGSEQARLLDQTANAQPALFALQVALYRLITSWGVRTDALLGHSVGEISAAHVAGVLSLEDACTLVATRAGLMQALPCGGAMASIRAAEEELRPLLAAHHGRVTIAGINSPASTVISGDSGVVEDIMQQLQQQGTAAHRLSVSHAFHSAHMDPMLEDFRAVVKTLTFKPPQYPIMSSVSGQRFETKTLCDPEYWVQQVRATVNFRAAVSTLASTGVTTFVEVGPQAVLLPLVQECAELAEDCYFVALLRKQVADSRAFTTALSTLHIRGQIIDWGAFFSPLSARHVDLPGYVFQRQRHWMEAPQGTDYSATYSAEQAGRFQLAGERIALPDGSWLHTLAIGPGVQAYIGAHQVYDSIVVPGAFHLAVMLAVAESHWPGVAVELRDVQFVKALTFDNASEQTRLSLHLLPLEECAAGFETGFNATAYTRENDQWVIRATAILGIAEDREWIDPLTLPDQQALADFDSMDWYAQTANWGFELDSWRDPFVNWGRDWWWLRQAAHVRDYTALGCFTPPAETALDHAPIHGALLDNSFMLEDWSWDKARMPADTAARLPFAVERLTWYGSPGSASWAEFSVREGQDPNVDIRQADVRYWDAEGNPVAELQGYTSYRAPAERFLPRRSQDLHRVHWREVAAITGPRDVTRGDAIQDSRRWAVIGTYAADLHGLPDSVSCFASWTAWQTAYREDQAPANLVVLTEASGQSDDSSDVIVDTAQQLLRNTLAGLQSWLTDGDQDHQLLYITQRALAVTTDEALDLAQAPLVGLLRSAQREYPERNISLLDSDELPRWDTVVQAIARDKSQLSLRNGQLYYPAVEPLQAIPAGSDQPLAPDPAGTVLITGGIGGLGAALARHLVTNYGARHLLLASRKANSAEGLAVQRELAELGASALLVNCDVGDKAALADMLDAIPADQPLTMIVHSAGVLDDGVLDRMDDESMARVMHGKFDAAIHLHALTRNLPGVAFVLYSSLSGVLGAAGQANYAAANTGLDALAAHRRSLGLAGTAIAWGPWLDSGMAARLESAQRSRLQRQAVVAMDNKTALAMFDNALASKESLLLGVRFNLQALALEAAVPVMLEPMLKPELQKVAQPGAKHKATAQRVQRLLQRLGPMTRRERLRALLAVVMGEVSQVMGAIQPGLITAARPLQELGMDSLMAVELRNRLNKLAGLKLPTTLLFNYPSVEKLAELLLDTLVIDVRVIDTGVVDVGAIDVEGINKTVSGVVSGANSTGMTTPDPHSVDLGAIDNEALFGLLDQVIEEDSGPA